MEERLNHGLCEKGGVDAAWRSVVVGLAGGLSTFAFEPFAEVGEEVGIGAFG